MITLTQLEYIVAIDEYRHFATAAEKCFVTQPTLSMQIKKLEDELGVIIFDRSRQPVVPTDLGAKLIEQARMTLSATQRIKEIIQEEQQEVEGTLKIGIIPTLAPYLLPVFIGPYIRKYPAVNVICSMSAYSLPLTTTKKLSSVPYSTKRCWYMHILIANC